MGLQDELDAFRAEWAKTASLSRQELFDEKIAELKLSGITERALGEGAIAPDFSLKNAVGETVRLYDRLKQSCVVITFYRGGWCPYCNLQLRSYQQILADIRALNGNLIAISPELPDGSLTVTETNQLTYDVLSDTRNEAAKSFGLTFSMPQELRDAMLVVGKDIAKINGDNSWELPVPGTFVISPEREIILAHIDVDYRKRLEPSVILATLEKAKRSSLLDEKHVRS